MQAVEKPGDKGRTGVLASIRGVTRGDIFACLALLILACIGVWASPALGGGPSRGDTYLQLVPWYSHLGHRLLAGDIPGWNPWVFAGAPFAGDLLSGWMYLPVMVAFSLFSPINAFTVLALTLLTLSGFSAYAFGRMLSLNVMGALVAGIAYQFSSAADGVQCCSVRAQVAPWIPFTLIGVELAIRSKSWLSRLAWWSFAGLGVSQILVGFLGQRAYYGLLVVGTYVLFRTMFAPPKSQNIRERITALALHGSGVLAFGFSLGAAGLLPRLDAVSRSMLSGGEYQGTAADVARTSGWHISLATTRILSLSDNQTRWYMGGAVFALAIIAPFVARRRAHAIYFATLSIGIFLLMTKHNLLHDVIYLLPKFQLLHEHVPSRMILAFSIGPSMLAGMAVDALGRRLWNPTMVAGIALLPALLFTSIAYWLKTYERSFTGITVFGVLGVAVVVVMAALLTVPRVQSISIAHILTRVVIPALFAFLVFWDPTGSRILSVARGGETPPRVLERLEDLPCYDKVEGASKFLLNQGETSVFRYFGYDSEVMRRRGEVSGRLNAYHQFVYTQPVQALLVGNQSMCLGIQDIQGYNPLQNARYVEYMATLNGGQVQEYHASSILTAGIGSPLLNALNARYIVIPAKDSTSRPDLFHVRQRYPVVYEDDDVQVLENEDAFPRAWIVHEAEQVPEGEALSPLSSGSIDLRRTAVLESEPPRLAAPADPSADSVEVTHFEPDRVKLTASTDAPGLVVLSQMYDPGWRAYVDGEELDVHVANHALSAIPLPAGEHEIVLRYDPLPLRAGVAISGLTGLAMIGVFVAAAVRRWQDGARTHHRRWHLHMPTNGRGTDNL